MTTPVIVSLLALLLSVVSLSWQAWSWFHSGPVLRVRSTNVFTDAGGGVYGVPEHYIGVDVINRGRAAATIRSWGIEDPSGRSLVVTSPLAFSDKLPARLEPHDSASFHIRAEQVREHAKRLGVPYKKLRPWVQVATGKKLYSSKSVPLA